VGTHGLGDTLAQLCLRYDGDEALEMVDKIYKNLRNVAYSTSVDLAEERGAFPDFDWELEKDCPFIKRLPKALRERMAKVGRRNISLLTQAPTGSVSLLSKVGAFDSFNVSSGVEPVFRNSYTRRKKINPGDANARVDFVDILGESWQEFTVYHSNVGNYLRTDVAKEHGGPLPDYFVTSDQINWMRRVDLQGIEQQYIDHSISSTINLPKGTSANIVSQVYMRAWKQGLKGVTVYVDGSRDGVLIADSAPETDDSGRPMKIVTSESPKRPSILPADILHATVKGVKWTILIGLLQNEPYELFMGRADKFNIAPKHKDCKLVKIKGGCYDLLDQTNNVLVKNVLESADNEEGAWTTRMMSMSLRHGVPIEYLVDQLSKDGSVVDVNMVLGRLLRKYMKKKSESSESCPKCGYNELIYEDSCKRCGSGDCSWSGCA
jgi:ribonucleoside-diphosphate reductase alpha chain